MSRAVSIVATHEPNKQMVSAFSKLLFLNELVDTDIDLFQLVEKNTLEMLKNICTAQCEVIDGLNQDLEVSEQIAREFELDNSLDELHSKRMLIKSELQKRLEAHEKVLAKSNDNMLVEAITQRYLVSYIKFAKSIYSSLEIKRIQ